MGAQNGRKSKMPRMAGLAEAIAAGETDAVTLAATYGITEAHMRTRLRVAGYDADTGLQCTAKRTPFKRLVGDESLDWQADAACTRHHSPELWFADNAHDVNKAQDICGGCDVRLKCLDWALKIEGTRSHDTRSGVYGGLTARARWALSKEGAA